MNSIVWLLIVMVLLLLLAIKLVLNLTIQGKKVRGLTTREAWKELIGELFNKQ